MHHRIMLFVSLLMLISGTAFAECYSDFDCGFGNKCIKASGDINLTGICVTPTDQFGTQKYDNTAPSAQPRNIQGCSFDTDCSIGFSCVKRSGQIYGICVK